MDLDQDQHAPWFSLYGYHIKVVDPGFVRFRDEHLGLGSQDLKVIIGSHSCFLTLVAPARNPLLVQIGASSNNRRRANGKRQKENNNQKNITPYLYADDTMGFAVSHDTCCAFWVKVYLFTQM